MKKKIVIVSTDQFGYLTDTYKYSKELSDKYDITYICFEQGLERVVLPNIKVIYVNKQKRLLYSLLSLNFQVIKVNYTLNPDIIFCVYNPLMFLLRWLIPFGRIIMDIRTGSVTADIQKRKRANNRIKFNTKFFKEITIISEGLARHLGIAKYKVLPLGADYKEHIPNKSKQSMDLIYVGTLSNRNIVDTVKAFNKFVLDYGSKVNSTYTIIGFFSDKSEDEKRLFLEEINKKIKISYKGRKKHDELTTYFNNSNIGVSYIPITEYYNYQPPTKTFEYINHGLITIATKTYENKKIINKNNGILCEDNETSFYNALVYLFQNINSFHVDKILDTSNEYSWNNIVNETLVPILESRE